MWGYPGGRHLAYAKMASSTSEKVLDKFVDAIESRRTPCVELGFMNEYGFLEYRAKLVNSPDLEGNGELARARRGIIWIHVMRGKPIHCLIRMEVGSQDGLREHIELEQEAGDLVLFALNPGYQRRISHSTICEVDEERLRQLGPSTDCHIVGNAEIYFYSCNGAPRVASGYL